jgi:CIC family chloride channel protein
MAALVGAATGAVVTSIVMIFEMTRDYNVIVPLMLTVSVAYGARRLLMTDSIYTMKLTRRGHIIPDAFHTNLYMLRSVADFIRTPMQVADADQPLAKLFEGLQRQTFIPHVLVTRSGKVQGNLPLPLRRRKRLDGQRAARPPQA